MQSIAALLQENTILTIAALMAVGYLIGSIRIRNVSLGAAGILIAALVFGHFGITTPAIIQNLGLVSFVTSVGFIAGPNFMQLFKGNAARYFIVGIAVILSGVLTCVACICLAGLDTDLALGLLSGALTTTPGLAAAIESTGSDVVSLGYGIAYPFGVLSVVLFVQVLPRILHANMEEERKSFIAENHIHEQESSVRLYSCDPRGFFGFSVAVILGIMIGKISIPLPGGAAFSLGTSGGPLCGGLICGAMKRIGKLNLSVKKEVLVTMRDVGLALFLIGAGTHAGSGFVEILAERGMSLFIYGAIMAIVPILTGYLVSAILFRMNLLDSLGSICGGMTSTPALGTLIQVAGTDDVASAYAATYPIALAMIVIAAQLIGVLL